MKVNQIYHGDNLHFMPDMKPESIDLIYIDPPFGTQSLWQSKAFREKVQELKFYDIFGGGDSGYINFMVPRLRQMHRLLKPTGSLFVHLDWRMSHCIKMELDKIFGVTNSASSKTNFINEIIWFYPNGGGRGKSRLNKKHDTILWYAKDKAQFKYNWKDISLTRNKDQKTFGGYFKKDKKGTYQEVRSNNKIYKYYVDEPKNNDDVWFLNIISQRDKTERLGYPTQKPLDLLKRIILMASDKNDLIADFFCGCGTAIDAAQILDRRWIGMDASHTACEVMQKRMEDRHSLFIGIDKKPMTYEEFKKLKPLQFEKEAVRYIGGVTNDVQIGDGGIDGRLAFDGTPIQVKKSEKPMGDTDHFRSFYMPLKEHGRGIFITLSGYTNPAKQRANDWRKEGLDIQLLDIKDILAGRFREQPAA